MAAGRVGPCGGQLGRCASPGPPHPAGVWPGPGDALEEHTSVPGPRGGRQGKSMASWDLLSLISFFHLQDEPLRLERAAQAGQGRRAVGVDGGRAEREGGY